MLEGMLYVLKGLVCFNSHVQELHHSGQSRCLKIPNPEKAGDVGVSEGAHRCNIVGVKVSIVPL